MPWNMVEHEGQFCLVKKGETAIVKGSCHANKADTMAMMRALYANEKAMSSALDQPIARWNEALATLKPIMTRGQARETLGYKNKSSEDTMNNESLTYYGGAVKALGGGKIGGYLIIFGDPDSPDLQGEFFTKDTDFFIESGEKRPLLYRHGAHPVIKGRKLGTATLSVDEIGIFMEAEIGVRDNYEKGIYKLAEMGKLGLSSGSMGHLVTKRPNGKSMEILTWPIGEASLTPNPVEYRTAAIPLKSLEDDEILDDYIKSVEEEDTAPFSIAGIPAIAQFCEDVSPHSRKDGIARSDSAAHAAKEFITIVRILGEAYDSFTSRLVKRSEHRFLKEGREIDPSTAAQVEKAIAEIEEIEPAIQSIKDSLLGIRKLTEMTKTEQKAMDEKARLALWNYYRISGTTPEELQNVSRD